MKIFRYIVLVAFVLLVLFFIVSILLPSAYKVERSRTMSVSPALLFEEVNSLKNWEHWSPWLEHDSTIVNTYEGPDAGPGCKMTWTSENSGNGSMTITGSYPNDSVVSTLALNDFGMASVSKIFLERDSVNNLIKVTWTNEGNLRFFMRIWGIMMDGMMGKDFAKGLENIEKYLQSKPLSPENKTESAETPV